MQTKPFLTAVLLFGTLGFACKSSSAPARPADEIAEAYAIYKLAIEDVAQPVESMPVLARTVPNHQKEFDSRDLYTSLQTSLPGLRTDTLDDFWTKNSERSDLQYKLDLAHGSVFIRDEDTQRVPAYPGYVEVSNVGFDSTATQALLYVGHCWELSGFQGRGYYLVYEKRDGEWTVTRKQIARMK